MDVSDYHRRSRKRIILMLILIAVAVGIAIYSLCISKYHIGFSESLDIVAKNLQGIPFESYTERLKSFIVWDSHVPMAIAAILVGGVLGISGAVMQILIRNPVADPYTTGISSGALFGVAVFIILGAGFTDLAYDTGLIINAFIFSLIPVGAIILFSIFKKVTPTVMVLIGIAVMYVFSAMTTLLKYTASEEDIASIYAWSVGTLDNVSWDAVPYIIFAYLLILISMMLFSNKLNVLSSGESASKSLGENPTRLRLICLVLISVSVSISVCFTGTIGFVGLIAPHISRVLVGSNAKYLIPCSAVCGSLILIVSECVARCVGSTGLDVGVVTALIGGPVFLYFLIKLRKGTW